MNPLQVKFIEDRITYTGEQLHSLWAYRSFGLLGDSAVAFVGGCDVRPEYMRDVEDLRASSKIYSEEMLHLIVEHFDTDLNRAILRQRILVAIMAENLNRRLDKPVIIRRGSDLYDGTRKLSVSIATASPVSSLIHAGINVSSRNTPVPTRGLDDYHIAPRGFAEEVLQAYAEECAGVLRARCKVRPCE